jgi:tryptophan-rich sensory protein
MPPVWLTAVAWASLAVSVATALAIVYDIRGRGRRQRMAVMEVVWPVTTLYFDPLTWLGYRRLGMSQRASGQQPGEAPPRGAAFAGKVAVG